MSNALNTALSRKNLDVVWRYEGQRLRRSCFGVDRQTGTAFQDRLTFEFFRLRERSLGNFKPAGLLAIAKPKLNGGNRIICVPTVADRVLQFAMLNEFRETLEKRGLLNPISYGLIRSANRTVNDARKRAIALRNTRNWVYKADIEKFFDNIPRDAVRSAAAAIIPQRSLHRVVLPFIDTEIEDGFDPEWKTVVSKAGITPGRGVRQGMPLSPYFAGMVLRDLDRAIQKREIPAIRYVDDIVAFFETKSECENFHKFLQESLDKIGLSVGTVGSHDSKTRIYGPDENAIFLGMEIFKTQESFYRLKIADATIQKIGAKFAAAGNIDTLLHKNVTLPRLGGFLDAMEAGYLQAYAGAENHAALVSEVRAMKKAALNSVLEHILGERVYNMGRKERHFLGI
jgi:RNA-directed DNA polymerase